jgi:hypothetical protein
MEHPQLQMRTFNRNGRNGVARVYPGLVKTPSTAEREVAYHAALKLVAKIDDELTRGIRHYRNKAGVLLTTLDEVVRAILDDDLQLAEETSVAVNWMAPQELAA